MYDKSEVPQENLKDYEEKLNKLLINDNINYNVNYNDFIFFDSVINSIVFGD